MTEVLEKKQTVGALSRGLTIKDDVVTHSPLEQTREQLDKYEENLGLCVEECKRGFDSGFYVVVLTKKEKLMPNVMRNYFFGRISCPTPDYDQIVYTYDKKGDELSLLWVIPDKKTCKYFKSYSDQVDPSQWTLLKYVLDFADGTFFKLAKKLNGEKELTPELKDN